MSFNPPPPPYGEKNHYQQGPPPPPMAQPMYPGFPMFVFGDYPIQCACPSCGNRIITRTEKKSGLLAWLICAILFFVGMWLCCCIPFCVDACKDTEHFCPSCNTFLGKSKHL